MIEIKNISKKFGKNQVLDNINITCNMGECIAIIGPNGCGKTTLIKSILGMVLPNSGEILINAKSIKNDFEYRRLIGYMPQIGRYPDNMSISQVFEIIKKIRNHDTALDEELPEQFQLHTMLDKKMCILSGGTTQKVSASLAFLFRPDILILDEPTAGLDPLASEILKNKIIKEKQSGKLVLITSHILSELDDLITQLIFMQDSKVVFHKNMDDLRRESGEEKISKAIANILKQQKS